MTDIQPPDMPPAPPPERPTGAHPADTGAWDSSLTGNRLLAALPAAELARWRPLLTLVPLAQGQTLYESGAPIADAWFPTSAIVSLVHMTEAGGSAEVAMVGREGLVGIPLFMGDGSTPGRAVVQAAGLAFRMPGPAIRAEFQRSAPVMQLLLRYTQALIAHMAQTAVCNRHHSVDKQLCRWLLLRLDHQTGPELTVTHEQIAHGLGVRREGVTEAVLALQRAGLIDHRRGHIAVLDRAGLEQRCCECYAVVKAEYARLLPRTG